MAYTHTYMCEHSTVIPEKEAIDLRMTGVRGVGGRKGESDIALC